MKGNVREDLPRAIEVRARRRHRERRIIIIDTLAYYCPHAGCFFAHFVARKAAARFTGNVEHECLDARVAGADILNAATNEQSRRYRLATLAPLHQNFEPVDFKLRNQGSLAGNHALEV